MRASNFEIDHVLTRNIRRSMLGFIFQMNRLFPDVQYRHVNQINKKLVAESSCYFAAVGKRLVEVIENLRRVNRLTVRLSR